MRIIATILLFFVLSQAIGIFTGLTILRDLNLNPYINELLITSDAEAPSNALFLIGYILFGALMMIAMIRLFRNHPIIFRIMEFFLISMSSSIVFYSVLRLAAGYEISTLAAILMGLAFSGLKAIRPGLKNSAAILATAGVGVIFGVSLGMVPVLLFLILLSIYDFLSVFATRHMVELASFVVSRNLAFTVTATEPPKKKGEKEKRMDLGTGDMIAPVMLEVSALSFNPVAAAFVFAGAVASMAVFLSLVYKKKMVLPALPPIVLGMITGLLVGFLTGAY